MAKYAKPVEGSTVADYRAIDKRGHYEYIPNPEIVISRNGLEQVRAKEIGYTSRSDMTNSRKSYQYKRWYYGTLSDEKTEPTLDRTTFEKMYLAARNDNDFGNLKPDGTLAKLLVAVGLRDAEATYSVGSTPSKKPR